MTDSNISVNITAQTTDLTAKLAVAQSNLRDLSSELRQTATAMREAGSAANDNLKAQLVSAAEGVAKAQSQVSGLKSELRELSNSGSGGNPLAGLVESLKGGLSPLTGLKAGLTELFEVAAAAFAVEKIAEWAHQVAESGAQVLHLSQQLGLSTEAVSAFGFAAQAMGLSLDQAGTLMERLEKNLVAAQSGTGKEAAAFQALGLSARDLKNLSIDEVMNRVADAFAKSADGPDKTAIAMALMGRAGAQMIPLLDQGRAGLAQFRAEAEDSGTVLSGPMAEGMEKTVIGMSGLWSSVQGLGISLFELFKPAIDAVVSGLTGFVRAANDSIREGGALGETIKVLVAAVNGLVIALSDVVSALNIVWQVGAGAFEALNNVIHGRFSQSLDDVEKRMDRIKQLGQGIAETTSNLFTNKGSDLGAKSEEPEGEGKPTLDASGLNDTRGRDKFFQDWKGELDKALLDQQIFGQAAKAYELQFWQEKLAVAQAGGEQYTDAVRQVTERVYSLENQQHDRDQQIEAKATNDQVKELDKRLAAAVKHDDALYSQGKITNDERAQLETAYTQEVYAGELQLMDRLIALLDKDTAAYQAAADKKREIEEKLADDIARINDKRATEQARLNERDAQAWSKSFGPIDSAFNTLTRGILSGRQTLNQGLIAAAGQWVQGELAADAKALFSKLALFAAEQAGFISGEAAKQVAAKSTDGGILTSLIFRTATEKTQTATSVATHVAGESTKTAASVSGAAARTVAGASENSSLLGRVASAIASWLGLETSKTAATVTNAGVREATEATAQATGLAQSVAAGFAQISIDAAVAAAGAMAAISAIPFIGPFIAPPIAAATYAETLGWAAGMGGGVALEVGAWEIPSTMQATLHKGESVVPADFASGLRSSGVLGQSGADGAGHTFNITVNASHDGQMSGEEIAAAVAGQVRLASATLYRMA